MIAIKDNQHTITGDFSKSHQHLSTVKKSETVISLLRFKQHNKVTDMTILQQQFEQLSESFIQIKQQLTDSQQNIHQLTKAMDLLEEVYLQQTQRKLHLGLGRILLKFAGLGFLFDILDNINTLREIIECRQFTHHRK